MRSEKRIEAVVVGLLLLAWTALVTGGVMAIVLDTGHVTTAGTIAAIGGGVIGWALPITVIAEGAS